MTRLLTLACAVLAIAAGGYYLSGTGGDTPQAAGLINPANAQETAEVDTSTIVEMTLGAADAPVTLIEYASYTCPHCANFHNGAFKQLKADYIDTGKVRMIYREVYFDRFGLWASMVARCGGPEKFFGITDLIYQEQSQWTQAGGVPEIVGELRRFGRLAGLDNDTLEACLQDADKAQTLVAWYRDNATADDITATPSFVLNGQKISNQSYSELSALIDAELNE